MTGKYDDKLIDLFLNDDLDNDELEGFLKFVDTSPEYKEELTIQFLVKVGMQRLEDGNTFNLKYELEQLLKDAKKRLKVRKNLVFFSYTLELIVVALVVATVILVFTIG